MKHRLSYTLIFLLLMINSPFNIYGESKYKGIKILGLKNYTEEFLKQNIGLKNLERGRKLFVPISAKITAFYQENGYTLAKVYFVEETADILIIFVDEGQMGRIVFRRLNSIEILKMKYEFQLKNRIYNKNALEEEINRLKKTYNYKEIKYNLIPATEGDKAFFQLDQEITVPGIGKIKLPFFDEYDSRYNLEIEFISDGKTSKGIGYGLRTNYSKGFIPGAEYNHPSFINYNDLLVIGASAGLFYGFDFKFKSPPRWTFVEIHSDYHFAPWFENYFTPMASVSAYYSRASRPDIGLLSYDYLKLRGILAPGITLLNKLHIYAGAGGERVFIFTPKIDHNANYIVDVKKHTDTWAVFESRIRFDMRLLFLEKTKKQQFETVYNYYLNNKYFHELNINWESIIEFQNLNFYILNFEYDKIWKRPPFYHEYSVSNVNFKGFMGKSYYTRNVLRGANEYMISIYRDSYYFGLFTDLVRFEGSGYDLFRSQYGIVGGIAGHIVFLDQFEFNIYFGKDYLFSKKESQYNLYLNIRKKW